MKNEKQQVGSWERGRRPVGLGLAAALLISLAAACAAAEAQLRPAKAAQLAGCPVLPADNIWNAAVDTLPIDANSAAYVATIGADIVLHPDFGTGYGIPFTTVSGSQPKVPVSFQYQEESDPGPYPIPADAPIEGGPNSTGDRHVLVLERDNCVLYELFAAYPQADGSWRAGSGASFDLKLHRLRPAGWTSADAAGLPILPGLVRYEEVAAGQITHAIRFTAPRTQRKYVWPARHYASSLTAPNYPPMGIHFRLKASFDISGFSAEVQVILRALKKYGMMLADNGSAWYITGAPDPRWNNDRLVRELRRVKGSDFEAVDVSSLMANPDSGQVRSPRQAVVNGASLQAAPVAPGEVVSIFGTALGPATPAGAALNALGLVETSVAGTRALFDGAPAPLLYVHANQVNTVVPYAVAGKTSTELRIEYLGARSDPETLAVAESAPGIFTADSSGEGLGVIFHSDWSLNSPANPAIKGSVVIFYATGEGQTDPAGVDGKVAANILPRPVLPVSVRVGGVAAQVLYAGAAPGFTAGLMQVNALVPEQAPSGNAVPIVLTVGSNSSPPAVTLAIR